MRPCLQSVMVVLGVLLVLSCASSAPAPKAVAPEIDPTDPLAATTLMRQGQGLVGEGRFDDGIARYRAAMKLQPTNPTIHNLLGVAELEKGETVKALDAFNRALELAPSYSDARNNRGAAYARLGQVSLAEADFLAAVGDLTYANRAGSFFNLGALYLGKGNLVAAEENLRRAATPSGPVQAYVLLAQVEERLGKPELAEAAYRSALERAPERPEIPLALGRLVQAQGRLDEARELLEKVVSLAPGSPEAAQALALLGR